MAGTWMTPEILLLIGNRLLRIACIVVGAMAVLKLFTMMLDRLFIPAIVGKTLDFNEKRARTMLGLVKSLIRYLVYFVTIVLVMQEFRIDTTSLVAGAGIVGLALGVGAQSLIKDLITGFFIIMENQFAVGDYIVSGDMGGHVEEIGIRVTKLRDFNGVLHIIPHGAISRISNHTRGRMQAVVNVPVAYSEDMGKIISLLQEACRQVAAEVPQALEGPNVVGVVEWRSQELVVRMTGQTVPLEQTAVETALRLRIKELFDNAKVVPPNIQIGK